MPKEFNPDEYLAKVDRSREASIEQPQAPDVSYLESLLRGSAQGLSFGGSEEITGGVESLLSNKSYEQARDEAREKNRLAQEANPITYTLGEIGGAVAPTIASAFIPGGQAGTAVGAANIATKTPTLLRLAGMGAGQGALSGLGYSEGQNVGEIAEDVATGGAMGAVIPAGLKGLSKIPTAKIADTTIKKSLTGFTRKTDRFLEELEKNPKAIERIESKFSGDLQKEILPEINEKIYQIAEKNPFAIKARQGSARSIEAIPEDLVINKNDALKVLNKTISDVESDTISKSGAKTKSILEGYYDRIVNYGKRETPDGVVEFTDNIEGKNLKTILQNLDQDIESFGGYNNPFANSKVGNSLKDLRHTFDTQLKSAVPEYKNIMQDVDKNTRASKRIVKTFMNKEGIDENKIANFTKRLVGNSQKLEQRQTKKTLELLEQFKPTKTLGQDLSDLNLKKAIEARGNQGSNIATPTTMAFGAMGTGLGGMIGGFGGAGIGGAVGSGVGNIVSGQLEQKGGQIAKNVLEATKGIRTPSTGIADRSLQNISSAATRGGTTLLNDFLSQQRSEVNRKKAMQERGASR